MTWPLATLGAIAVARLGETGAITRRRYAAGSYVDGLRVEGASADVALDAVVWPATPKDLLLLPEGQRTEEIIGVITVEELRTADRTDGIAADEVLWQGRTYSVLRCSNWLQQALFFHSLATRVNE